MKNIIKLRRAGGSVGFSLTKVLKSERLNWSLGDYFTLSVVDKNEIVIRRLEFKKKTGKTTQSAENASS